MSPHLNVAYVLIFHTQSSFNLEKFTIKRTLAKSSPTLFFGKHQWRTCEPRCSPMLSMRISSGHFYQTGGLVISVRPHPVPQFRAHTDLHVSSEGVHLLEQHNTASGLPGASFGQFTPSGVPPALQSVGL
jgi:hypothetical protein